MKEFVVGSPYTTETTLDEDDEFLIVACDGVSLWLAFNRGLADPTLPQLWDVTEDQDAVDLIRSTADPQKASKLLLDFAMQNYSTDNLSVMVVRFKGL
jgi:protein phosphatase PTC1